MIAASAIVSALNADSVIATTTGGRVYDHDIRTAGWETTLGVLDGDGVIQPLLMVQDGGSARMPFVPAGEREVIHIYAFGPRTDAGRDAVDTLLFRATDVLHGWQDATTGAQVFTDSRVGKLTDGDMVFDRVSFRAGSILAVSRY